MMVDKKITKEWIKAQGKANLVPTSAIISLGFISTILGLVQAWGLAETLSAVLSNHPSHLLSSIFIFISASVCRVVFNIFQENISFKAGKIARRRLRSEVISRIIQEGPSLLRRQHSSLITTMIVDRIEMLDGYFGRWVPASALWLISQWTVVLAVFYINHKAGIILALCCASLPVFQAVFGIAIAVASRRQFLAMTRLQTRFLDRVKGIATIVLSGSTEKEASALSESAEDLRLRTMKVLKIAFVASATTDVAMVIALVLIVITQAHTLHNSISENTLFQALFAILLVPEAFSSFRALSAAYQDRAHASAAAEAMHDLSPLTSHIPERSSSSLLDPKKISITAQNLTFSWDNKRSPALFEINFYLPAGQTLILEGPSGAGKSTLIELLLGFISPTEGKIFFNDQDMASLSPQEISSYISWIGQKPIIFAGTIRENILFAKPDASEEELQAAISAAAINDYLPNLSNGLETRIGEGGFGVSGGQAQRIAIARTYLKNTPILLLDEPTSHLDPATEQDILESLKKLSKGKTVVLSSHSSLVKTFQGQHLVLNKGHISSYSEETL
ncbi:thiol reductant ABC exporter subunit CydD [Swingsia samuiensis]|uniref:Thiol reductant ABC exporter subunit CydD n=2 Tax=Swingsia samuiensis TaxID=1293412 RepID=A0A4Y6UPY0_9PROT|nr:thiol reductant ABC exporter subunit CydD [Swingsia samuiensis]